MNPSYAATHERINSATDKYALLSNERRASCIYVPAQSSLIEGYSSSSMEEEEDYGSTTSIGTRDVSIAKMMAISDLTVGGESLTSLTDPIMPLKMTYAHQTQQVYMQHAGDYMMPREVQAVPPLLNISQPQQLQPQNAVHSIKQQQSPALWASIPITTAGLRIVDHVSYSGIQENDAQPVSPNVFSDTASNANSCGYINSPVLSSVSCNPDSSDMPPVFHLHDQNLPDCAFPDGLYCSISPYPVLSVLQSINKPPVLVSTASSHSPMNLQTTPANAVSLHTSPNEIEKTVAVSGEEDEDVWTGTCRHVEYQDNGARESIVIRRSANVLEDYIYTG